MNNEILNVTEASELTRLKPATIYLYVESGRLPHLKIGRRVLFERHALMDWLTGHRVEPLTASVR